MIPPLGPERLRAALRRLLGQQKLERENLELHRRLRQAWGVHNLIGVTPSMKRIHELVLQVAGSRANVLVTGESGTGKELVARAIHEASPRARGPFIPVNCGAFSESLIAERAVRARARRVHGRGRRQAAGVFEQADGGTLFLDEVAELALTVQAQLLRVLQDQPRAAAWLDARDPGRPAHHRGDEQGPCGAGGGGRVPRGPVLPPARGLDRAAAVAAAAARTSRCWSSISCVAQAAENAKKVRGVTRAVLDAMLAYSWPGNVRELENTIQSMVVLCNGDRLTEEDLPPHLARRGSQPALEVRVGMTLAAIEREAILKTLAVCGGNRRRAAEVLGIGLRTLFRRLKEYEI